MNGMTPERLPLTFRRALAPEILSLRHRILRNNDPSRKAGYPEDSLPTTFHFGAIHENEIIGCLTILASTFDGKPAFQLRGMAIDRKWQGRGIGKRFLNYSLKELRQEFPGHQIWCNARVTAREFYAHMGWKVISEVFDIPGVGLHCKMILTPNPGKNPHP